MQIPLAAHQRHVLIRPEAFECARRFEGVACNTDINECVRGTSNCAANSTCTNSRGAFDCACWAGYTGTALGQRCSLTLANLEAWSGTIHVHGLCDMQQPLCILGSIWWCAMAHVGMQVELRVSARRGRNMHECAARCQPKLFGTTYVR